MLFLFLRFVVRLAQAAALLAVALVLLFFGLTRTEVGRDGLRGQIVAAFDRQFEGSLEIGTLAGNLVYDLWATDVRLRDGQGRVVLAADSVVLAPTWGGLLRRRLVIDEATLVRPRIALVRDAAGRWNLADVFVPRTPSTEAGQPLDVRAPELRILDGTLTTRREGEAPGAVRNEMVFDYTETTVTDLTLHAELDWTRTQRRLRLREGSARLPLQDLTVHRLDARLDLSGGNLRLRDVVLETDGSRIEGDFALLSADNEPARLSLTLAPSRLDGAELTRVVPAVPMADVLDLSAHVSGPLDDLAVSALTLERGATAVRASGSVRGLPDAAAFTVALAPSTLRQRDLEAVWPTLRLPDLSGLGTAAVRLDASGTVGDGRVVVRSEVDARTDAGRVVGDLRLGHRRGQPLSIAFDGRAAHLDPGLALGDPALSGDLSGRVALDAIGTGDDLAATLRLALTESRFAGRTVDSLRTDLAVDGRRLSGTLDLTAGGTLHLDGEVDLSAEVPAFDLALRAAGLDLHRLFDGSPETDLTAEATLTGAGAQIDAFAGDLDVAFGASSLTLAGEARPIAAHDATLRLRPAGSEVRLDLDGDLAALQATGDFDVRGMAALAGQWAEAVARTVQAERAKTLRLPDSLRAAATALPEPAAAVPQAMGLKVEIRHPAALRALVPGLPGFAPGTTLDVEARLAPGSLALTATAWGDSLRVPGLRAGAFDGSLAFEAPYGPTLLGESTLDLDLRADPLWVPIGRLADATATFRLRGPAGELRLRSAHVGEAGPFALDASVDLRARGTRVTLRRVEADVEGQQWASTGPQTLNLYADAIQLHDLAFERVQDDGTPPRLALYGTLSTRDTDSLHVDATALDLGELSAVLGPRLRFGGRLDAEVAVARVLRQPTVVGTATAEAFAFAGRRVGRVDLTSRYVPGVSGVTDGVTVDLRLRPDSVSLANDLGITGTVRFPGTTDSGARDPGALDLALDLDRLDLFVFDWLFPAIVSGTTGYAAGTGRITGTPRVPYFEADLAVREGAFRVPAFGLALQAEGRVTVDREGFHLRSVQLTDKAGGLGLVRGDVLFNDYRYFSLDLAADLAEVEIIDVPQSRDLPFYGYIRATGSATLTGPLDNVFLRAVGAQTTPDSEMFIPVTASGPAGDAGFLVFADSLGNLPEAEERQSLISSRPEGERAFLDGLEMNLGVVAPPGSTVHLVFDPSVGDEITAVGSARLQLAIQEGEFRTFGTFDVARGDYLFTAGDVFTRRFGLEPGGTLRWSGDPIDARLDLPAAYRTRASLAGLDLPGVDPSRRVPLVIGLDVSGQVTSPLVDLSIALDETNRDIAGAEALRRQLNQADRQAEYATSVLLTNSFLLAPSETPESIRTAADELFFTSLSQLVSTRLNLFLSDALASDNLDVTLGVQQGATADDLGLTYGVALRLLDERLVIRGEGLYQRLVDRPVSEELQGEVAVEVRLTPSVSLEVFYRREGDVLLGTGLSATPYDAYGAGLGYETDFASWRALLRRLVGRAAEERDETASAGL